jgi:homocysteine S-methyltransferase
MSGFAERLRTGVVVADGAMGSLVAKNFPGESPTLLARQILEVNHLAPSIVHDVHMQYIAAGAELIETNTFGANRPRLERLGLDITVVSEAVAIARGARDASGKPVWIGGSVSPLDAAWLLETDPSPAAIARAFSDQVELLIDRGVDLIVLETFPTLAEIIAATRAVRAVSASVPVVAQMTFDERGMLASGEGASDAARRLIDEGADAVGVNCGLGPHASLAVLAAMARAGGGVGRGAALSIMPNAGFAQRLGGRVIYPDTSAATYAAFALEARSLGARIIGGCCGTTPRQIQAIAAAFARPADAADGARDANGAAAAAVAPAVARARAHLAAQLSEPSDDDASALPAQPEKESRLAQMFRAGRFVWSLQIDPQRGPSDRGNREVVEIVAREGLADIVDINSSGSGTRQDSLQIAAGIERIGVETLAHITPRDATVAGVLAQVLGAHDWGGVRNVLVIAGDPPRGDFVAEAKGVYQVDTIGLVRALDRLRRGQVVDGRTTIPPFALLVGVAVNQNAPDMENELARLEAKIDAGADFVMTQPFFRIDEWAAFWKRVQRRFAVPIVAGAWPLSGLRQAIRINENVSGVAIPEPVLAALAAAGARERETGFALADAFCRELERSGEAAGVYVVAPFKQPRQAIELFRGRLRE